MCKVTDLSRRRLDLPQELAGNHEPEFPIHNYTIQAIELCTNGRVLSWNFVSQSLGYTARSYANSRMAWLFNTVQKQAHCDIP